MKNDNPRGFFNWQGNNLSYDFTGNYVVITIIVLSLILGFFFKSQINGYFIRKENQKILFWQNINSFLQTIGFLLTFIWVFRIIILEIYNYPIYYEHIPLHICRFHFFVMSLFLMFKKKEWIRYILYLSFSSSIIGVSYGTTSNDLVGDNNIFVQRGFTYYNAGIDTHYYWDYHLTHLLVGVLPIIISIGVNKRITTVEFYRILIFYYFLGLVIFGINFATDFASNKGWRSNYWFLGKDRNNDYKDLFGWLTKWPQNVFFYLNFGVIYVSICHFAFFTVWDSFKNNLKQFLQDQNKTIFKQVFTFNKN